VLLGWWFSEHYRCGGNLQRQLFCFFFSQQLYLIFSSFDLLLPFFLFLLSLFLFSWISSHTVVHSRSRNNC
jgi:hypothetical protein